MLAFINGSPFFSTSLLSFMAYEEILILPLTSGISCFDSAFLSILFNRYSLFYFFSSSPLLTVIEAFTSSVFWIDSLGLSEMVKTLVDGASGWGFCWYFGDKVIFNNLFPLPSSFFSSLIDDWGETIFLNSSLGFSIWGSTFGSNLDSTLGSTLGSTFGSILGSTLGPSKISILGSMALSIVFYNFTGISVDFIEVSIAFSGENRLTSYFIDSFIFSTFSSFRVAFSCLRD